MAGAVEAALDAAAGRSGFATPPDDLETVLDWDAHGRREAAAWAQRAAA